MLDLLEQWEKLRMVKEPEKVAIALRMAQLRELAFEPALAKAFAKKHKAKRRL